MHMNYQRKPGKYSIYQLGGLSVLLLIAYTWTSPFRHLYGLEARNALFAREMLENGMSLIPKVLGKPYPDYPGLYFWLETIFSSISGHVSTFTAVLPSALSATGIVLIVFFLGCRINLRAGWFAAAILATIPEFWLQAGQASIDMLLAFHVTAAMACLFFSEESLSTHKMEYTLGAYFFMTLAFFTKGPIGIVLPGAAWAGYLLLERRFKSFFRFALLVGAVASVCVTIHMGIVWLTVGGDFIRSVIRMQVTDRLGNQSNHPVYYYIICLLGNGGIWLINAFPSIRSWGTRIVANISQSDFSEMLPANPMTRVALVWFMITAAIFTMASTRHSRYLLPLYPALAVLIASGVDRILRQEPNSFRFSETLSSVLTAMILFSGGVGAIFFSDRIYVPMAWIVLWMAVVLWGWWFLSRRIEGGSRLVGLIALFLATGLSGANLMVIPHLSRMASGRDFTKLAEARVDPNIPVVLHRINPDGNGIKYALYSKQRPSALRFIETETELKDMPAPYLLISRDEHRPPPWEAHLSGKKIKLVTRGKIRSHRFSAHLIETDP